LPASKISEHSLQIRRFGLMNCYLVREPDGLTLNEGDMVDSLKTINTAGHTPGHLAFVDEREGSLYVGDALVTFSELRLPFDPPWTFPLPKGGTWHFETSFASGERLAKLKFERILAGHGPAIADTGVALRRALGHAQRALGK
jgi:glyoxylase-like metal-dependent hydrolase (beta-lactamase superfamily II)